MCARPAGESAARDGGWRLIEDPDGARGWMLAQFLSRARRAGQGRDSPDPRQQGWQRPGAVARGARRAGGSGRLPRWLVPVDIAGRKGFVAQDAIWGAGTP
jgi:hypothetical protein